MRRASVTNTANVSGGGETNTGNDAASDPTTIDGASRCGSDLTKSHAGNFSQGQVGATYTLTAHNVGAAATGGFFVTVTDTLPASLSATAMGGPGWVCTPATTSCTRSDTLAAGASYPPSRDGERSSECAAERNQHGERHRRRRDEHRMTRRAIRPPAATVRT